MNDTNSEDRAFKTLESLGIPRERARSVENGIMVLDQRYRREIADLESALVRYGKHLNGCKREDMLPCDCGLTRRLEFTLGKEVKP